MKNKFERLSKEEQKNAINEYMNAKPNNKIVIKKLKNLKLMGIIAIVYSLLSFVIDLLINASIVSYIIDAIVLISGTLFIIKGKQLIVEYVNDFLIGKKK